MTGWCRQWFTDAPDARALFGACGAYRKYRPAVTRADDRACCAFEYDMHVFEFAHLKPLEFRTVWTDNSLQKRIFMMFL